MDRRLSPPAIMGRVAVPLHECVASTYILDSVVTFSCTALHQTFGGVLVHSRIRNDGAAPIKDKAPLEDKSGKQPLCVRQKAKRLDRDPSILRPLGRRSRNHGSLGRVHMEMWAPFRISSEHTDDHDTALEPRQLLGHV